MGDRVDLDVDCSGCGHPIDQHRVKRDLTTTCPDCDCCRHYAELEVERRTALIAYDRHVQPGDDPGSG